MAGCDMGWGCTNKVEFTVTCEKFKTLYHACREHVGALAANVADSTECAPVMVTKIKAV